MSNFAPTAEQKNAIDLALTGESLAIEALAGAGKTATLASIAELRPRERGTYTAFNKAIVEDSKGRFPASMVCKTMHGLAWSAVGYQFKDRVQNRVRERNDVVARTLGITDAFEYQANGRWKTIPTDRLASLTLKALKVFCSTDDLVPGVAHVPWQDGLDHPCNDLDPSFGGDASRSRCVHGLTSDWIGHRTDENNRELAKVLQPFMVKAWQDMCNPKGVLPYDHAYYLKLWELSAPKINSDFILLDEAQDASPVFLSVLAKQNAQIILVGDRYQSIYCQPLGTMVDVPNVKQIGEGKTCCVAGCHRKRDHRESAMCDKHEQKRRGGAPLDLIGVGHGCGVKQVPIEELRVGDMISTYHNGTVYAGRCSVAGINRFRHEGDLVRVRLAGGATSAYTPEHHCIVKFDHRLDDDRHAVYLMRKGTRFRIGRAPLFYRSASPLLGPVARCHQEKGDAVWILSIHATSSDASLAEMVAQAKYGIPSMRFEPSSLDKSPVTEFWSHFTDNTDRAATCLTAFNRLIEFPLWDRTQKSGGFRPFPTAAANLVDGMCVLERSRAVVRAKQRGVEVRGSGLKAWVPITVTRERYDGDIVSIEVERHHNYFADGILTHNSFTGARNAMSEVEVTNRAWLTQSWRFGPRVAEVANLYLEALGCEVEMQGNPAVESTVGPIGQPDAILCRTNASMIRAAMAGMQDGRSVCVVGGTKELIQLAEGAQALQTGRRVEEPQLQCFDSWDEVVEFVESDPNGDELALLVKLVDDFGAGQIIRSLSRCAAAESEADLLVSTAHRSKGRQWSRVTVASGFPGYDEETGQPPSPDELRLQYVAATRAQHRLDPEGLFLMDDAEMFAGVGMSDGW